MIRTKIPGGLLTSAQMRQMAAVSDFCAAGKGHLTTRQNMQYHFVPLAQVPGRPALAGRMTCASTTREVCYNTVRNVTACPLAGIHPEEPFDVQPYARRLAFAFLHKELTDSMPRKFKVAFSGCPEDCIATAINDVGLRAIIRDGVNGFSMTVAGGSGDRCRSKPSSSTNLFPPRTSSAAWKQSCVCSTFTGIARTRIRRG